MKPAFQSKSRNPFLRLQPALAFLTFVALSPANVHALTYTWDGTNNAPWSDAKWSDGTNSAINWVNGGGNDAVVNSGDVWSPIQISANSLTIGDGVGGASSASARFATNNAFWGITSITINSDGYLAGSANCTSHLLTVNLNGGTIGGDDNGGDAAFYGVIALHGPVNVNGGAVTSTISTTGGGVLLVGPTAGQSTEFNVADGAAAVDLLVSGNLVHKTFGDSEKLLKTGTGTMVLSGTNTYQGDTTVSGGILSITTPFLYDGSTITIDSGAKMDLDFTGYDNVGSLVINGATVANGIYNKDHPTYGSYFTATGAGSLVVGGGPSNDGIWSATANGDWSANTNWQSDAIANGPDRTANFSAGTGIESITATLDSNRTIGNLAFTNANYTITGTKILTLESSGTSFVNVGTGLSATINSKLASSLEVAKTGNGTLNLYAGAGDNFAGTYDHSLGGMDIRNGTVSLDSQFIKLGPINIGSGATLTSSVAWATGASNPWFNGCSAGPVTVQAGGTLSTSNVANGIMEGLTLLGGTVSTTGPSSPDWGNFTIASTVISDGSATSTISAELAIVNSPNFDVVSGSTLNITGVMHHRFGGGVSGILKSGDGLLILGGVNTFTGNTTIDGGTLQLADNAQLKFDVSDSTSNTVTGGGTATFNGDFNIDTTAVTGTTGGNWPLVNLMSLSPASSFSASFTVIGFDDSNNDGIWIKSDAKGAWSFSEATGELTLVVGTDYDTWGAPYGLTAGSEGGDLDGDGLINQAEYAFGLIPNSGSSVNPVTSPLSKSTGKFSYTRRATPASTGLTYTVWTSVDLVTWTLDSTATASQTVIGTAGAVETVEATIPGTLPLTQTKLFIQVRAN